MLKQFPATALASLGPLIAACSPSPSLTPVALPADGLPALTTSAPGAVRTGRLKIGISGEGASSVREIEMHYPVSRPEWRPAPFAWPQEPILLVRQYANHGDSGTRGLAWRYPVATWGWSKAYDLTDADVVYTALYGGAIYPQFSGFDFASSSGTARLDLTLPTPRAMGQVQFEVEDALRRRSVDFVWMGISVPGIEVPLAAGYAHLPMPVIDLPAGDFVMKIGGVPTYPGYRFVSGGDELRSCDWGEVSVAFTVEPGRVTTVRTPLERAAYLEVGLADPNSGAALCLWVHMSINGRSSRGVPFPHLVEGDGCDLLLQGSERRRSCGIPSGTIEFQFQLRDGSKRVHTVVVEPDQVVSILL